LKFNKLWYLLELLLNFFIYSFLFFDLKFYFFNLHSDCIGYLLHCLCKNLEVILYFSFVFIQIVEYLSLCIKLLLFGIMSFIKYFNADFAIDDNVEFLTSLTLSKDRLIFEEKLVLQGLCNMHAIFMRNLTFFEKLNLLNHRYNLIQLLLTPSRSILGQYIYHFSLQFG